MRRPAANAIFPLALSTMGVLGLLPFALLRAASGDWLMAGVDALLIAGFAALGISVLRLKKVRIASLSMAVLCGAGAVATVYLRGEQQVFWAYPALLATFYLVRPREGALIATVILVTLFPLLVTKLNVMMASTVLATLIATGGISYAFSLHSRHQRDQLLQLARKDPLTNAGNRRALDEKLSSLCAAQTRSNASSSLVLIDIDNFKEINDLFGHAAGDDILVRLTKAIQERIRVTDSLYRIGGEEFVVVIEGQTKEKAHQVAEQLRALVEGQELAPEGELTISLGVAGLSSGESPDDWLRRADLALYQSKHSGRNQTSLAITGRIANKAPVTD